jgi:hypothetical protein
MEGSYIIFTVDVALILHNGLVELVVSIAPMMMTTVVLTMHFIVMAMYASLAPL